ncbi:MAG: HIT domain-containing protein [Thermodesulfobacteriota bacterium]|jgi:ATP adenylyltransferase
MRFLWAPWRIDYILEKKQKGCIFCNKLSEKRDQANLILYQGKHTFVMMNKFPYNNGHVMVVPKCHCPDLEQLDDKELRDLFFLLRTSVRILKAMLRPDGFNIGTNIGKVGGAGVDDHIHFHIVPRWIGDTNFMPVLGETKIIPEYLEKTYEKLHAAFMDVFQRRRGQREGRQK